MTTVRAIYKDGRVEFLEPPPQVNDAELFVTFVEKAAPAPKKNKMLTFGMYKGDVAEEDLKAAEFDEEKFLKEFDRE